MAKANARFSRAELRIFRLSEEGQIGTVLRAARDLFCEKSGGKNFSPTTIIKQFYLLRGNFYDTIVLCENDFGIVCQCHGFQIRKQFLPLP